ncbi:MAG TPA: radical SAM protein [Tepidisphaeraceae bacterium]|nr:radical SAM protein [Tepidisphaeraceae bacterium]
MQRAQTHYHQCALCEHRCHANRLAGQIGPCKAGPIPRLYQHRLEYGDELELVPSHLFYLSGCDLRCVFCIAELDAFDPSRGQELTHELFHRAVAWGRSQGARNLQWIGGEPTIHLPALLEIMSQHPDLPPIIWKSDFHGTPEAFDLLDGIVHTYVADLKFGNDACASRLAGIPNYLAIVTRNLQLASRQTRLIVRHLLLPGHTDCCLRPILDFMREHMPDTPFSLRDGYLPHWRASQYVELTRSSTRGEIRAAKSLAQQAGLNLIQ